MQILKRGSKGPEVTVWQTYLRQRGFDVKADGDFGPATEIATRAFQRSVDLEEDGQVGPRTRAQANARDFAPHISTKVVSVPAESHVAIMGGAKIPHVEKINAAKLATICPIVAGHVKALIAFAAEDGVGLQIVQGLRTFAEQDELYKHGRSKPGPRVTNARGGQSLHNYGLAVDIAILDKTGEIAKDAHGEWDVSLYPQLGKWAAKAGLEWGGSWKSFKDLPHVQDVEGMNLAAIQQLYRSGGLAAVWARIR